MSVVTDSYSSLVRSDIVEIDETFIGVGNIVVKDSVAMVLYKTLGTISVLSVADVHKLYDFTLGSSWYYRPFVNDKRLQMVRTNHSLLKKINYPTMKFTGLQQNDSTIILKAMCYYVLSNGSNYAVLPASVVFLLNTEH